MKICTHRKKGFLFLCCFVSMTAAMQEVGQGSLRSASCWSRLKGVGRGLSSCSASVCRAFCNSACLSGKCALNTARFLSRPDTLKIEAVFLGVGATVGLAKAVWNRALLYEKAGKLGLGKSPWYWNPVLWIIAKKSPFSGHARIKNRSNKIYKWRLREYPTVSAIKYPNGQITGDIAAIQHHREEVVRLLAEDWAMLDVQQIAFLDFEQRVLGAIGREIEELERYLSSLESYVFFPCEAYDWIGIDSVLKNCCIYYVEAYWQAAAQQPDRNEQEDEQAAIAWEADELFKNFNDNTLSLDQERELDRLMKESLTTKLIHWTSLCPNFGKAATMYWEILKRVQRLKALRGILVHYYRHR